MVKPGIRQFLYSFIFLLSLASCQKVWVPVARLPSETDVKVTPGIPVDERAEALIAPFRQQLTHRMSQVIGRATQELRGGAGETTLGNFVADVQRIQGEKKYKKPIDISIITSGGLRTPIPAGNITLGNIFELMPFENQMLVLTLPGSTLQKLFEHGARVNNISISNASFTIKDKKPEQVKIGGKPLSPSASYTLVTSDYLANGGDNLFFLKEATKIDTLGFLHRDMLIKHIEELTAQNKPVEARLEGRIK